ncbi:MAG: AAA family ATPase [Vulcanisaeta sp.]
MVVPVLFDLKPKSRIEDLYDFKDELNQLMDGYLNGRIIALLGIRRMGKSSLLRSFLNSFGIPNVLIDVRRIIVNHGTVNTRWFLEELGEALSNMLSSWSGLRTKLIDALSRVRGISITLNPPSISLSWGKNRVKLASLLDSLNHVGSSAGVKIVLAIDEIQELRNISINLRETLAYIYDNLPNIVVIVTGSQVGLVYDTLKLNDPSSPLYGRAIKEIKLRRLSIEESIEFLKEGFREANVEVSNEHLERAANALDGIIGWLTYYGWNYIHGNKDLDSIMNIAARQEVEELQRFLTKSRAESRYRIILKALANRPMRWSEIKMVLEANEGISIDDHNFTRLLDQLIKMSIVEKYNGYYKIADPVLEYGIKKYL